MLFKGKKFCMLALEYPWTNIMPLLLYSAARLVSCCTFAFPKSPLTPILAIIFISFCYFFPFSPLLTSFNFFLPSSSSTLYQLSLQSDVFFPTPSQSVGFHVPPPPNHLCHGSGWPTLLLPGPCQREESPYNIHCDCWGYVW